jgi:hypothetical protein
VAERVGEQARVPGPVGVYRPREGETRIENLARHLRQSCRACSIHPAGPVVAVNRILDEELSATERDQVLELINRESRQILAGAEGDANVERRERLIRRFAEAVLG